MKQSDMSLIAPDYLTASELAQLKNVTVRTVYSWVSRGISPPWVRERGEYWFHRAEAEAFQKPRRGRWA